ncbi:NIC-domain-containing protein [Aulographum hederae CBS 113979]|uniref:NIC-domain-containing protein n=1 Tax=Aulographum hederae CBS 113979 TaxID=1176131 RepID=A0A6G1H320_9PEZI|nr:NIC-domain-containing protein [Aulographum hederae CBS 113979]
MSAPFGASSNQTSAPSGLSLFPSVGSGTGSQAPSSGSLFGAKSQPPASSSHFPGGLFAGLGTSNAQSSQPQTTTSGGLFGSLGATTGGSGSGTGGGLFSGLGDQQTTAGGGTGAFGGLGQSSQQQTSGASTQLGATAGLSSGPASTSQNNPGQHAQTQNDIGATQFMSLLERSKKRQNQANGAASLGDLPTLQLSLGDIARKARNLGTGGPSSQAAREGDSRAHYLLAASGVNTAHALRDLTNLSAQVGSTAPSLAVQVPTDDNDLSILRGQSTVDLIAEGLEQSKRDFDAFLEENVQMEWDAQRRRIYEHFGLAKQSEDSADSGNGGKGSSLGASVSNNGAFGRSSRKGRGLGASASLAGGISFGTTNRMSVLGTPFHRALTSRSVFPDMVDKTTPTAVQSGHDHQFQRDRQEKYAEKVRTLNSNRVQELTYPLFHNFASVEREAVIDNTATLVDAYDVLIKQTGEQPDIVSWSDASAIRERAFKGDYLAEQVTANASAKLLKMRKQILHGSRTFLELQFYEQLLAVVNKNPREAALGGEPGVINQVKGYIRVRATRKDLGPDTVELQMIGNDYCWATIYYLFRSGCFKEALQYVKANKAVFRTFDAYFLPALDSYIKDDNRKLPLDIQSHIHKEYLQRSRLAPESSLDPYRLAVYKILGRCELAKRSLEGISSNWEDWIWLQFSLAREGDRAIEAASDSFGLDTIQTMVGDIGQRHFQSGGETLGGYGTFFLLQTMAGMYEQAVAWLYPHNQVAAVHFAIGLCYYGLLRVADLSASELLSYNTRQQPRINFGIMLGHYTGAFRTAKVEAATDYLVLICLNADLGGEAGSQQAVLCHEALRELVLETREFAMLLGDIHTNGHRIMGVIEARIALIQVEARKDFLRTIAVQAAAAAADSGRVNDAVLLYHLAEQYDNVFQQLNNALSDVLATDIGVPIAKLDPLKPRSVEDGSQPAQISLSLTASDDPIQMADNMRSVYNGNEMYYGKIKEHNRELLNALMQLAEARNKVEESKWAQAIDRISQVSILPLGANGSISLIRTYATNFNGVDPLIARNVGAILMWAVTCCLHQRDLMLNSAWEVPQKHQVAKEMQQNLEDLRMFAGLLRYKLAPRVYVELAEAAGE